MPLHAPACIGCGPCLADLRCSLNDSDRAADPPYGGAPNNITMGPMGSCKPCDARERAPASTKVLGHLKLGLDGRPEG